jgi:putative N-acetylmannosamine-6-phosphate epimerase
MHEAGKSIGSRLPDAIVKPVQPVPEAEKTDLRKIAEGGWQQVAAAAKGVAGAAMVVGGAVSGTAHTAVEHNFGKEADVVAQG